MARYMIRIWFRVKVGARARVRVRFRVWFAILKIAHSYFSIAPPAPPPFLFP